MKPKVFQKVLPLLLIMFMFVGISASQEPLVNVIEIKGLRRIDEGALRAKMSQKIGEPLVQEKISEDIKTIFKMGYFDDIKVDIEPLEGGYKVIFVIKEKPTIIKVDFQGNREFDDSKLREIATINPGALADIALINDVAIKLRSFYEGEGFYHVNIVPVVKKISEEEVTLTYQIEEGKKVKIRNIIIKGNRFLSTKKIKKVMKVEERKIYSFIVGGGYFKREEMKADIERIKDLYYDHGYLNVAVAEPIIELIGKEAMDIIINISEGQQYNVSSFDVTGNEAIPREELIRLIKLKPKKPFSKSVLKGDVASITDRYANHGYALAVVSPEVIPDEDKKMVKIVYRITEGEKYTIGRINITGNTKTRDKVIRREIRLDEGDVFNAALLKRSYERLNNLQFFETVEIIPSPKVETKEVDLEVKVKEKPTGFLSIGGGYSSVDGFIGIIDITQGNLFGRGQYLKLRGQIGGKSTFYEFSFKDPWFMDKPISFGTSIYRTEREYGNFDRKSSGFELSFGKSFWEYWHKSIAYNFERTTIFNVKPDASVVVKSQEGKRTTSSISPAIVRDTRDSFIDPTRGSRNSLSLTIAGLGGTNAFIKVLLDSGWYFPLFDVTSIHFRTRIGYASGLFNKELPLYERYYVGGIYTVRGLNYGDAGPKDVNNEPLGGEKELIFNAEYIFPILSEFKLKGVVFFDAGRAYDKHETFGSDLRYTTGAGIRWISPIGPIRIEWGFNLDKRAGEPSNKVEFTFGTFF
ncbi:MAG: outer membrane protein assembly factor BamA [Thermodesulfovibrionales bacterium]|nr:outer membrane protein assembly factor BamA [Thermodesulfovibrionales bacterium]